MSSPLRAVLQNLNSSMDADNLPRPSIELVSETPDGATRRAPMFPIKVPVTRLIWPAWCPTGAIPVS